jgi:DNA-binding LytR/AlgR family response regulator
MMVRAFIVDDEPPARVRLRQLLSDAGGVIVVGEAGDAIEARTAIADSRPDVVFLDIEMPETSGTELAASLPEPRPFVVFATAFDHYALAAFAVDATDYLVKPITRARLAGTLARVRERLSRRSDLERDLVAAAAAQRRSPCRHAASAGTFFSVSRLAPPASCWHWATCRARACRRESWRRACKPVSRRSPGTPAEPPARS